MTSKIEMYKAYLEQKGFDPTHENTFLFFKQEGLFYAIVTNEDDPGYFRLVCPNFWSIDSDKRRARARQAANHATAETKVAKIHVREDGKNMWGAIEMFFESPEQFKGVFTRSMDALRMGMVTFAEKMKELDMASQEELFAQLRENLTSADDVAQTVADMRYRVIEDLITRHIPKNAYPEQGNISGLHADVLRIFNIDLPLADWAKEKGIADAEIRQRLIEVADRKMAEKVANYGPDIMRMVEKSLLLQILDQVQKEHLLSLRERVTQVLAHIELQVAPEEELFAPRPPQEMRQTREDPAMADAALKPADAEAASVVATVGPRTTAPMVMNPNDPASWGHVYRNAPCPCGSGKKFKHCHG